MPDEPQKPTRHTTDCDYLIFHTKPCTCPIGSPRPAPEAPSGQPEVPSARPEAQP